MSRFNKIIIAIMAALLIAGLLASVIAPLVAAEKLTTAQAKQNIGETATVCGLVADARYAERTQGEPTFLNLDKSYPNAIFTVLICGADRVKFGKPEVELKGKRICVTGKIADHQGTPEIIAKERGQIELESK